MIVAPSDHLITDTTAFTTTILKAAHFAATQQALVTLGIQPFKPHTGYGYIKYQKAAVEEGIHQVDAFTEKPDLSTAKEFLEAGIYLWNAGIFIWQASTVLEAFSQHASQIYDILQAGWAQFNTDQEQAFIDEAYPTTPSISIDYAIMEKADNVYTLPAEFGWSDLGSWNSIYQLLDKDENENVVSQCGTILEDTSNTLIHADPKKLIVVKGLENYIIVDDADVLLIYPKADEQAIKQVTNRLKEEGKSNYL